MIEEVQKKEIDDAKEDLNLQAHEQFKINNSEIPYWGKTDNFFNQSFQRCWQRYSRWQDKTQETQSKGNCER